MSGISLLYLPSDGPRRGRPVQERSSALNLTNRPPQQQPQGAAVIVVEHDDEDAIGAIQTSLRDYPRDLMDSVGSNNAFVLPQLQVAAGPASSATLHSFSSVLTFQGLDGDSKKYAEGYGDSDEISKDAKCTTTVGTWIRKNAVPMGSGRATVILLVIRPVSKHVRRVADSLEEWFQQQPGDLKEMQANPLLIYVALYNCFNSYTTMLDQYESIYRRVARLQERNAQGIFGRTYQCNKCLVSMSYCQQDILAHKAALESLQALLQLDHSQTAKALPKSNQRLQNNITLLKADLEDFKSKLDVLTERLRATLDLDFNLSGERLSLIVMWFTIITVIFTPLSFVASIFSVVEADPIYFFIALTLTLLVSIIIVIWLYSSVMNLGSGLKRRDLHKLIGHIPYKNKLGFPTTTSTSSRVSSSRWIEEEYPRREKRRSSKRYQTRYNSIEESSSSDAGPPPMPMPPGAHHPFPAGPSGYQMPPMDTRPGPFAGRGRPPPPTTGPRPHGVPIETVDPGMGGRPSAAHERPSYGRTSASELPVYRISSSKARNSKASKRKKSDRHESVLGSLSYSRRPVTSELPEELTPTGSPHYNDEDNGGPSRARRKE